MIVLLDSDVIIECLRGRADVVESLRTIRKDGHVMACTVVNWAEIHAGLRTGEEKAIDLFFNHLTWLDLSREVGRMAGSYLRTYARGHGVKIADALMAATASVSDAYLYTFNRKHYPMPDIRFWPED